MAGREIGELRRGEESVGGDMGVGVGVGAGVGVRMRVRRTLVGRRRSALSTQHSAEACTIIQYSSPRSLRELRLLAACGLAARQW